MATTITTTATATMVADVLDAARRLRAMGCSVIPVPRGSKRPMVPWREYQHRRATDAEMASWFSAPSNLGVVTGAVSGVVVIDADSDEAAQKLTAAVPYSPRQIRTPRGVHVWYRHPGGRIRNATRAVVNGVVVDIRADGGFVLVPPSRHPSGEDYQWSGDWQTPADTVPTFSPSWLARSAPTMAPAVVPRVATTDAVTRAAKYLAAVPPPQIGHGSDHLTLTMAARLVRGFAIDTDTAVTLLWEWAGRRPGWSLDWVRRKVANAERYGSEPRGALL